LEYRIEFDDDKVLTTERTLRRGGLFWTA
jgi:hypothetical protein